MSNVYIYENSKVSNFYPLPANVLHLGLSSTASILYSILLGRTLLSQKNHWVDDEGRVYVRLTYNTLAEEIKKSYSTVKVCLRELEEKNLIERKRIDDDVHIIYTLYPNVVNTVNAERVENNPRVRSNTTLTYGRKQPTNKYSDIKKYTYKEGESF